jgi:cytoskeletal protein RodZ
MAKGTFGERLKRERELREVSLNEVTAATRISTRFLEALENEDWNRLPGGAFNRGFVRAVARYLGLDEESLLAEYDMAHGGHASGDVPASPETRIPSPPKWILPAIVVGTLVVIAGLVAAGVYTWHRFSAHRKPKQSSAVFTPSINDLAATCVSQPDVARVERPAQDARWLAAWLRYNKIRHQT